MAKITLLFFFQDSLGIAPKSVTVEATEKAIEAAARSELKRDSTVILDHIELENQATRLPLAAIYAADLSQFSNGKAYIYAVKCVIPAGLSQVGNKDKHSDKCRIS